MYTLISGTFSEKRASDAQATETKILIYLFQALNSKHIKHDLLVNANIPRVMLLSSSKALQQYHMYTHVSSKAQSVCILHLSDAH